MGVIAGCIVFALFIGLGLTLLNRVASPLPVIILGIAGAYAGWLVGVIAFGSTFLSCCTTGCVITPNSAN